MLVTGVKENGVCISVQRTSSRPLQTECTIFPWLQHKLFCDKITKRTSNPNSVKAKEITPHNGPQILAVFLSHLYSVYSSYQNGDFRFVQKPRTSWNCALDQKCKPIPSAFFHPVEKLLMSIL